MIKCWGDGEFLTPNLMPKIRLPDLQESDNFQPNLSPESESQEESQETKINTMLYELRI
jgi:hypothetical protein